MWSNINLLPLGSAYLLFSRYIGSEWKQTHSFEHISDTFTSSEFQILLVFFEPWVSVLDSLEIFKSNTFLQPRFYDLYRITYLLYLTPCLFDKRYIYSRQTTLSVFRISQHIVLKEAFISTTTLLPASLSVYLLYKKNKPTRFNVPTALGYLLVCCQRGKRRGRPIYLCKIKQCFPSPIGRGDKAPPSGLVVIQHLLDFPCGWISLVHSLRKRPSVPRDTSASVPAENWDRVTLSSQCQVYGSVCSSVHVQLSSSSGLSFLYFMFFLNEDFP